eukprot:Nitzschia sp. Nitz4//scaffold5_size260463//12676//13743//NITZ4_000936-RA/size260463-augustus-gene-0.59-mRNA-1//1//CDS//3329555202//921//frame0
MVEWIMSAKRDTEQQDVGRTSEDPFPLKLHKLLQRLEEEGKQNIIGWNPDGRSFSIFQPKVFASSIMIQHFRQSKYKSFQRQLNLYDFRRETVGKIKGVYSHELFLRDNRDLSRGIRRVRGPTKEGTVRQSQSQLAMKSQVEEGVVLNFGALGMRGMKGLGSHSIANTPMSLLFDHNLRDDTTNLSIDTNMATQAAISNGFGSQRLMPTLGPMSGSEMGRTKSSATGSDSRQKSTFAVGGSANNVDDDDSIGTIENFENLGDGDENGTTGGEGRHHHGGDGVDEGSGGSGPSSELLNPIVPL